MKKTKLITLIGSLALVGALGVGATLAYFTDSESAGNVITMGHVDIELDEPKFDYENNTITNVVPNQTIAKDPTVTVVAGSEDCYLRAKIEFSSLSDIFVDGEKAQELLDNINISDEWVLNEEDGYYYYQKKVESNAAEDVTTTPLFTEVKIPETWGNEVVDASFNIDVTAEAIQANEFTPEMTEGVITGWFYTDGTAIEADTYRAE